MFVQTSSQIKLFYETDGNSQQPALLLLHGLGADHEMWQPQLASLPAAGFFVIVPDLRGHGRSSAPETFTIQDCARDLHELLAALNTTQAHVVGVSMGGMVAQQLAVDYPQNVASLMVVDSLSGVKKPVERFNAGLAAALLAILPTRMQIAMIAAAYNRIGKTDVADYFAQRLSQQNGKWVLHLRQQVNQFNLHDRLPEIKAPTLVLVGDHFGAMAIEMARTTAQGISGAKFEVLPGGGDPSNLLVPEAFDQAVLAFIRQMTAVPTI